MNTSKNKIKSLMLVLFFSAATISTASARVCFLPDSTDCGEGDVVGGGDVDVPCQYSSCPAYNTNYQECYDERTYNNGGVNVTCKQIKCKLSKSECEKQEADPNSSQCCNFDSDSGCYYMGSCKLCNRDVFDSEKNLGEGYNCYPCKDKNGTFYICTAIEKECKDIKPNYTSSCGDSQIAKEVEGIKDSKGNQCYTCKDKPIGCTYEYRQATTADSCGLRDFENTTKCMDTINGCLCYTQLKKVSSVYAGGAGVVVPFNRISNKSATCVDENNVTRYQTICQGTPKSKCSTNDGYEFRPNGCVSDTYNNGFEVKGDEWGDCVKTECNYEYVHLTKNDTGTDNYDRQRLRYGKDGEICTTEGSTREQTSSCSYSCSNGSCKCGSNDGPICSPAGSSCKIKQKCAIYRDCEHGTKCFNAIQNNPSITGRFSGTPEWGTIYNKISNNSASCVANGVRKYETLCEGTIKEKCQGNQTLVPNGCVSDIYSDGGVYVAGAIWGNCVCPTDKEFYDTAEECKKMTGKNCTYYNFCYQTCESRGSFSTQEACLNGKDTRQQCLEKDGCYYRKAVGFTITQSSPNACGGWSFGLIDADGHYVNGSGIHEAGNYSVIIYREGRLIHYAGISSIQSGGGWCFGDQADDAGCEKSKSTGNGSSVSKAHSFQDGWDYTIYVSCL